MIATLPPDLQQFVREEVASGHYRSEDELVLEAVRYYRESNVRLQRLREEIRTSLEQLDRGEGIELADDAAREAFFDEIGAESDRSWPPRRRPGREPLHAVADGPARYS